MWWAGLAMAQDAALEAQVRELVGGLVPAVEAAAGRRFDHLPRVVLTDPATETPRLVEQFARTMPEEQALDTAALLVSVAFAAYLPDGDEIVVFADNLAVVADDETLRSDVLRCTLAHELVHALQAQQVPEVMRAFDDDTLMQRIAIEGHATTLGERACERPAGVGYLRWASGGWVRPPITDGPVGLWGPGELMYGWGSRWVERRIALGGPEAAWELIAHPPDLETFEDEVLEDLHSEYAMPAWPSADQVTTVCAALGADAEPPSRRYGGPTHRMDPNYPWWPGSYQDWELVAYLRTVTSWRCTNGVEVVAIDAVGAGPVLAGRTVVAERVRRKRDVVWIDDQGLRRWEASGSAHHVVIYPNPRPNPLGRVDDRVRWLDLRWLGRRRAETAMRALGLRSSDEPGYDGW